VVVEDSLIGLQAAAGAHMKCVITYTHSTSSQNFLGSGAVAVYEDLDDVSHGGPVTVSVLQKFVDVQLGANT
jgi:beta-phosphoglucomutase-like phosphatase (HAD superfamily)